MRYTTIIDITELESVYRNVNCRLLYLHMCLKSGYHDTDRDQLHASLRNLAAATGLTLSATRHAISKLIAANLLSRTGDTWQVLKWVQSDPISSRPKSRAERAEKEAAGDIIDKHRREEQERLEKARKAQQAIEEYRARNLDYHRKFVEEYERRSAVPEQQRTMTENSKLSRNRRWYLLSLEVLENRKSEPGKMNE